MYKEHPDYRNNIELLNMRFPDHDMLSADEVMVVFGIKSRATVKRRFNLTTQSRISKAAVAKMMCGTGGIV